jgi:hypothetical protein
MKIYSQDVKDIGVWISFILFLFAVSYLAEGGSNLLVILFVIAFSALAIGGIMQSLSEYLKNIIPRKRVH